MNKYQYLVNQPIDRTKWDNEMSSLTSNAYFNPEQNSINILPGILAGDIYDPYGNKEENMGGIGVIVGHEITHSIDNLGSEYDDLGRRSNWWDSKDKETFSRKTDVLKNYYSALSPYPGALNYDGNSVQGEAMADMGGLKGMLGIAAKNPDFDYDLFFRAFARSWCSKYSYGLALSNAKDVHPMDFLRVNVVLQQFDKFNETYDIS